MVRISWSPLLITGHTESKTIDSGCRCEFTDWSSWSSCEASIGGGFQQRNRDWKVKDGKTGQMCPTRPRHPDYTLQERRDGSPDGQINCLQNTAMSLHAGLKEAGRYKDLVILLDESTSIKVSYVKVYFASVLNFIRHSRSIRNKIARLIIRTCHGNVLPHRFKIFVHIWAPHDWWRQKNWRVSLSWSQGLD